MIEFYVIVGATGVLLLFSGLTDKTRGSTRMSESRLKFVGNRFDKKLVGVSLLAGIGCAFAVAGVSGSAPVAAVFGVMGAFVPVTLAGSRSKKELRLRREGWPDVLATLVSSIRAGVSLPEACMNARYRAGPGLADGFEAFTSTYRSSGSFEESLESLRARMADPVADRVAVALQMAHDVGGSDLVRILRTLADQVRDDLRIRREIEARWSWTVTGARVAAVAPWIVLLMMSTRQEAANIYASTAGIWMILFGAAATFTGYRLMLLAARLPEEKRLGP